jgi:hypothetical protein
VLHRLESPTIRIDARTLVESPKQSFWLTPPQFSFASLAGNILGIRSLLNTLSRARIKMLPLARVGNRTFGFAASRNRPNAA